MFKPLISFLILILLANAPLKADTLTVVKGKALSYANTIIELKAYKDLITHTTQILASDTVDSLGNFNLQFQLETTQLIEMNLGIYKAIMYAEPQKKYEVALPPFQPKTKGDLLNPFFKPVEMYLGIKNADSLDINFLIADFNQQYHRFIDQNYYAIIKHPRKNQVDSLIDTLENHFSTIDNLFFSNYRLYKYAWLKFISVMKDSRYITREFFNDQPILYHNPAYMDLFNQIFANYLNFYSKTKEGTRLYSDIVFAKSPTYAKETFSNNLALLNDTLQELVLLKGLHDSFYSRDFPTKSMLITLDSIAGFSEIPYHRYIAQNIRTKVMRAKTGFDAPKFELPDADSVIRTNQDYLSNYVYLNFISIDSYTCQIELDLLKQLYEKHKNDFRVVSIAVDDDFKRTIQYFKDKQYNWMLLNGNNNEKLLQDYRVKVYPSYYLINPDGKLDMSPAPTPSENFEWHFFSLLKNQERNKNK